MTKKKTKEVSVKLEDKEDMTSIELKKGTGAVIVYPNLEIETFFPDEGDDSDEAGKVSLTLGKIVLALTNPDISEMLDTLLMNSIKGLKQPKKKVTKKAKKKGKKK